MSRRPIIGVKVAVFAGCLVPFGWLVYRGFYDQAALGADPVATITHTTGDWTLWLLLATLGVTPLRRWLPRLGWLVRLRRMLGLFAFFYATLHLLTYVWLYSGFDVQAMIADVLKRRFITVGVLGWLILLSLALTSTAWAIRKLGGARWRALHRGVYVAAIAGVIHYWWLVKPGVRTPLKVTLILTALLLARVGWAAMRHFGPATPKAPAAPHAAAPVAKMAGSPQ